MTEVLLVVSGADVWTLKDGTKHPTGYWAAEFIHPHQVFTKAGYDITIATPGGVTPTVDEISLRVDLNGGDQANVDAQRKYLADLGDALAKPARLEDMNPADFDAVYVSGGHGPMEDLAASSSFQWMPSALIICLTSATNKRCIAASTAAQCRICRLISVLRSRGLSIFQRS